LAGGTVAGNLLVTGHLLASAGSDTGLYRLDVSGSLPTRLDTGSGTLPIANASGDTLTMAAIDTAITRLKMFSFGTNSTLAHYRANGTRALPTASAANEAIFSLGAFGYGTTGYSSAPRITMGCMSAEAWSDTAQGTFINFRVTAIGGIVTSEAMRIAPSGNLLLGTTTDSTYKLDVVGSSRISGSIGINGTAPPSKPTVSGSRGSNAALASLLTALASYGLIVDSTS
jgi:hypothetical protein